MREDYEPFNSAEEVWFWFCASLEARGDGLRSRSDYWGKLRACEISDIYRIIKQMRQYHYLSQRHLRVMTKWGERQISPWYEPRAKRSEIRLWEEAMRCFEAFLINKKILQK